MSNDYNPNPSVPPVPNYALATPTGAGNYADVLPPFALPDGTSSDILVADIADRIGISVTDGAAVLRYLKDKGLLAITKAAYIAPVGAAPTQAQFNQLLTNLQGANLMATS